MSYLTEVTVRLATADELRERGYDDAEIEHILDKQAKKYDKAPGEVIDSFTPEPYKQEWGKFSIK